MTNKKIVWAQDISPFDFQGGAELNDKAKIIEGIRQGYDINILTPETYSKKAIDNSDLVILSNCARFSKEQLNFETPFIIYHHDYHFICCWRLYYPVGEKCKQGVAKSCNSWQRNLIKKAKLNIFLSDLHRKAHQYCIPEITLENSKCIPSSIDTEFFKPVQNVERAKDYLYVGVIDNFKGIDNILIYAQENKIKVDFYGYEQNTELCDKITTQGHSICGKIDYYKLPELYSKYKYAIHLPEHIEPYGRFCIEALLCGCKVITNTNNGAFSYPFMENSLDEIRRTLSCASIGFWEEIEKLK